MIPFFPKQIANRAIAVYLISLTIVSVVFLDYMMLWGYILLGILWVFGFFLLTTKWSVTWRDIPDRTFMRNLFLVALGIRLVWVIVSYFYYIEATGQPFEFGVADALGYHEEAKWLASEPWSKAWSYYFGTGSSGISDVGYPLYLTVLYKLFGPIIILPRIIKAFLSAYTCILLYRLSVRTFGENVGRMAGVMCALMLNLVVYCGYHLKETEMVFLEVAFLERADYLIRSSKIRFWNVFFPSLLALSLFFFRTVLGAAAVFSLATAVLVSNTPSMRKGWKRTALITWGIVCVAVVSGGTIMTEVEGLWEEKDSNMANKRIEQTARGNQWAKYATGSVMAPLVVVLPFSTMVNVDNQYAQQTKHAGNFIRNFMGFFVLLAFYESIRQKKLRDYALVASFVIAYLGVVSLSGFSNSERFLLPGLPGLIIIWTFGISSLRKETYKLINPWCVLVLLMEVGWAYFKLGSRGLF